MRSCPRLSLYVVTGIAVVAVSCTGHDASPSLFRTQQIQAFFASYEVLAGEPNRIEVGLMRADQRFLSYGTVEFRFSFLGTQDNPSTPQSGPTTTATFLPVPGTQVSSQTRPTFTLPTVARGVYEAQNVMLDKPGFWSVN